MEMTSTDCMGLGPAAFKQMLTAMEQAPVSKYGVVWKGKEIELPVASIDICHLRYNLFNTRIIPHHKQYIAKGALNPDYFTTVDKDSADIQKLIHGFLRKNPDRKEALRYFKAMNKPLIQEPLVSTIDGRILNGNQRLNVFRQLAIETDSKKFKHLKTAYVAILPDQGSSEDERDLEATFQDDKLNPAMFDWIQQGLWIMKERKTRSSSEIGKIIGKKQEEVNLHYNRITLAKEYLEYVGKDDYWVWLRDEMQLTQAFKTLAEKINSKKTKSEREKLKSISFGLMKDPEKAVKGKKKSIHLLIISASDHLEKFDVSDSKVKKTEKKKEGVSDLLKPISEKEEKTSEVKIDVEDDSGSLADEIINVQITEDGKRNAKNSKNYAKRQVKAAVTSFENILLNLDRAETKGLKNLVNKAIHRLEKIRERL